MDFSGSSFSSVNERNTSPKVFSSPTVSDPVVLTIGLGNSIVASKSNPSPAIGVPPHF